MSALTIEIREANGMAEVSPSASRMMQMVQSYWVSRGIHLAVRLGLPDALAARSRSLIELALETGADPQRLGRLLSALSNAGVFAEIRPGVYATTPLARTLESGRSGSLRQFVLSELGDEQVEAWEAFERE